MSLAEQLPQTKPVSKPAADAALMLLALIWGGTFVVVKAALHDTSVMCFLALRFGVASLCMLLLFGNTFRAMPRRQLWCGLRGGFLAGFLLWLGFAFQTWGLERTTAGNSGFLTGLYIVLVPLLSAVGFRRWPKTVELAGIALASVGIVLLTAPPSLHSFRLNFGDVLTIGCAIVFAVHLLVLGYFSQRERFEVVATGQIICTCLISAAALSFEPPRIVWGPRVVIAVLVTGLLATALGFGLQTWAQKYTSPTRTAVILSLEPVFAYGTAVGFAGEPLTFRSVLGGGLILAGILAVELRRS